jgi:hypothetical protein
MQKHEKAQTKSSPLVSPLIVETLLRHIRSITLLSPVIKLRLVSGPQFLAHQAVSRPRNRLEPGGRDLMPASLTIPIASARNPLQSTFDFLEHAAPQVGRASRQVLFSGLDCELHRIRGLEASTQPLWPDRTEQFVPLLE